MADAGQGVVDLHGLDLELALIWQHLPRHPRVLSHRRNAIPGSAQDLDGAGLRVAALGFRDDRADDVARERLLDEHDVTVEPCDSGTAVGERVDRELELVPGSRPANARLRVLNAGCSFARHPSVHEQFEQRLLGVSPVLGLVPDPLPIAVENAL